MDKSILISGCSSGMGYAAAKGLKERGYRVFATARNLEDVARLKSEGLESLQLDLDDSASIQAAVKTVEDMNKGKLYALFNNAAYGQPGAVEDISRETIRAQFESNLFGTLELTNLVLPIMRRQGYGRIIQNSSMLGFVSLKYRGAYNASKHALEALTDTLRLELRGSLIYVSSIQPGPIESRFRANGLKYFHRNIDSKNSHHQMAYKRIEERLSQPGASLPFALPSEAIMAKLIHALESKKPKSHYQLTLPAHLFAWMKRLLPTSLIDPVLDRVSS